MLGVSHGTYASMSVRHEAAFAEGVVASLADELPEEFEAERRDAVASMVRRVVALADLWLIDDEEAIGLLCAMALLCGEEMLGDPKVKDYILYGSDPAQRIIDLLDEIDSAGMQ